jgi:hypothetical protein
MRIPEALSESVGKRLSVAAAIHAQRMAAEDENEAFQPT